MDSFYMASGSSPPEVSVAPDMRAEPNNIRPLPEELIEALAAQLAAALVNNIRQYPDLRAVTQSYPSLPDTGGLPVTTPPETDDRSKELGRRSPKTSRARRSAHAPSD